MANILRNSKCRAIVAHAIGSRHEGTLQPGSQGAAQTSGAVGWAEGTNLAQRISEGHGRTLWKSLLHITPS